MVNVSVHQALLFILVLLGLAALWVLVSVVVQYRRVKKFHKLAKARGNKPRSVWLD